MQTETGGRMMEGYERTRNQDPCMASTARDRRKDEAELQMEVDGRIGDQERE